MVAETSRIGGLEKLARGRKGRRNEGRNRCGEQRRDKEKER